MEHEKWQYHKRKVEGRAQMFLVNLTSFQNHGGRSLTHSPHNSIEKVMMKSTMNSDGVEF